MLIYIYIIGQKTQTINVDLYNFCVISDAPGQQWQIAKVPENNICKLSSKNNAVVG